MTLKRDYNLLQLQQIATQAYEVVLSAEEQTGCAYSIHSDELDELRRLCEATEPKPYRIVTEVEWQEQQAAIVAMRQELDSRTTPNVVEHGTEKNGQQDVAILSRNILNSLKNKLGTHYWLNILLSILISLVAIIVFYHFVNSSLSSPEQPVPVIRTPSSQGLTPPASNALAIRVL